MIVLLKFGNVSKLKNLKLNFTVKRQSKDLISKEMKMKILNKRQGLEYSLIKVYQLSSDGLMFLLMDNSSFFQLVSGTKLQKVDLSIVLSYIVKISLKNQHLFFLLMDNLFWSANFALNFLKNLQRKSECLEFLTTWYLQWQPHQQF